MFKSAPQGQSQELQARLQASSVDRWLLRDHKVLDWTQELHNIRIRVGLNEELQLQYILQQHFRNTRSSQRPSSLGPANWFASPSAQWFQRPHPNPSRFRHAVREWYLWNTRCHSRRNLWNLASASTPWGKLSRLCMIEWHFVHPPEKKKKRDPIYCLTC